MKRFKVQWILLAVAAFAIGCAKDNVLGPATPDTSEFDAASVDATEFAKMLGLGSLEELLQAAARVDRMGMPAVATAVITSKNAYNQADPTDDAAGDFVSEIVANVGGLHAALDDDLTGLGLTPCATGDCVNQAAPFVVPDVIRVAAAQASGFPNGRRLTDQVIDVTLALILLDLNTHAVTALIGVNPTAGDLPFNARFPYLAPPHQAL